MSISKVCLKIVNNTKDAQIVTNIAEETIQKIYPHYYPKGAVKFFQELHSYEQILRTMNTEEIYLFLLEHQVIGTGSVRGAELCRLFILPQYQRKGYGTQSISLLEEKVFERESYINIDASLPAEGLYLKRGYHIKSYEKIEMKNGDFLCYHKMEKQKEMIDV